MGQLFTFCRFSRKRKLFRNFDCDFRKRFTNGFFLTEYEEFRNFHLTASSRYLQTAALKHLTSSQEPLWLIALYVNPKNSNHLRSHSGAIMALDHSRLAWKTNSWKTNQAAFFAFDKFALQNLGACKPAF